MLRIINHLCVVIIKYSSRFLKRYLMFFLIDLIFLWIPFKVQFF